MKALRILNSSTLSAGLLSVAVLFTPAIAQEYDDKYFSKSDRKEVKKEKSKDISAERIFEFSEGQSFTKEELRKKYHELLRQNHPDKVALLSPDFKKLAEQKTKDINTAYEKLKKKAA